MDFWGSDIVTAELRDAGVSPNATVPLDDPRVQSALQRTAELVQQRAVFVPAVGDEGYPNWQNLDWQVVKQDYAVWSFKVPFNTEFSPAFLPNVIAPSRGMLEGYVISAGTLHSEAAYRWLAFLSQNEPPSIATFDASAIPARKSYAQRIRYWERFLPTQATAISVTLSYPPSTMTEVSDSPAAVEYDRQLYQALNRIVRQNQTAAQAASEAQSRLTDITRATATPYIPLTRISVATPLPDTAQANTTPITFANTALPEDWLRGQIAAFQQQNPGIAVRLTNTPGNLDLWEVADTVDCLAWFRPPERSESQRLLDLAPLIDADATFAQADYPNTFLAPLMQGDKQRGLPYRVSIAALHTNSTLLQSATTPTSWKLNDMQDAAEQSVTGTGTNRHYGFALVGDVPALTLWYLRAAGAELTQTTNGVFAPNYTDPSVVMATRAFLELLHTTSPHTFLPGYTEQQQANEAPAAIEAGQVAIWLDTQNTSAFASSNNDQIAPLPAAMPPLSVVATLAITRNSSHPALCWSWLTFLSNQVLRNCSDLP